MVFGLGLGRLQEKYDNKNERNKQTTEQIGSTRLRRTPRGHYIWNKFLEMVAISVEIEDNGTPVCFTVLSNEF